MAFRDREDGGRQLAARLAGRAWHQPLVLALPRGGVPVGAEVAEALGAPLDVIVARKIGAPGHEELGVGAVAEGLDEPVVADTAARLGIGADEVRALAPRARAELARRVATYRGDRPLPGITDRDVILVDDGLATGVTAEAALRALGARGPRHLVLAVPVCSPAAARRLRARCDEVVCVAAPEPFRAVGHWYRRFDQTSDAEVLELLGQDH